MSVYHEGSACWVGVVENETIVGLDQRMCCKDMDDTYLPIARKALRLYLEELEFEHVYNLIDTVGYSDEDLNDLLLAVGTVATHLHSFLVDQER